MSKITYKNIHNRFKLNGYHINLEEMFYVAYSFIKEEYVLNRYDIDSSINDLYEGFKGYCLNNSKKHCCKTDFTSRLSEVQINYYKTKGYNMYKIKHETLKTIADKLHWINELDEYKNTEEDEETIINTSELTEDELLELEFEKLSK